MMENLIIKNLFLSIWKSEMKNKHNDRIYFMFFYFNYIYLLCINISFKVGNIFHLILFSLSQKLYNLY